MKGKQILFMLVIAAVAMLFVGAAINAEEAAKAGATGVMEMNNAKAFAAHKMGIVKFTHDKHAAAVPAGYGVACGECHHGKDGKPLASLKAGDKVQSCFECHNKAEKPPAKDPAMSAEDYKKLQVEYFYGAIHENCQGCHKAKGKGPVKCTECHPKPA